MQNPVSNNKPDTIIADVMSEFVLSFGPNTPFREAVVKLASLKSSCLIVVEKSRPIGIITERDIVRVTALSFSQQEYAEAPLCELMSPNPVCVQNSANISDALALSRSRNLRHLPVINDDNELVGIVTQTCLVNTFASLLETHEHLNNTIEQWKSLSLVDPLTELGNRRALEVELNFVERESKTKGYSYALALLDIDHFKKYNDFYGHQAGDKILQAISQLIKNNIRESDRVFRYGGEEILVIMPKSESSDASECITRVQNAVNLAKIPHEKSNPGHVTFSAGIAVGKEGQWKMLLTNADKALYTAKNEGRNKIKLAVSTPDLLAR